VPCVLETCFTYISQPCAKAHFCTEYLILETALGRVGGSYESSCDRVLQTCPNLHVRAFLYPQFCGIVEGVNGSEPLLP
jgi:hypothetical protein